MNCVFEQVPAFKESRLQSLFSDFSGLKDINPEGYEANLSAWENLLLQCLRTHTFQSSIALPAAKVSPTLASPEYGKPKSLDLVLTTLIQKRELVPWSIYKEHSVFLSLYADFLSPQKLWLKIFTSFNLNHHSPKNAAHLSHEFYLHFPTLVARSSEINTLLVESVSRHGCYLAGILDFQMFQTFLRRLDQKLSDVDIEAVFLYLSRDTGTIAVRRNRGSNKPHLDVLIKVGDEKIIKEEDFEILNLKCNIVKMENRVALLEKIVYHDIPQRVGHLLSIKAPETRLKNVLRRKHQLSQSLDLASSVSNELTLLLNKIDDAQSNNTVYHVLQSAKSALSTLNQKVSISQLESLTSELDNQVALTDEVTEIIGAPTQWNEEDISEEFELLEREYELSKEQQKTAKVNQDEESTSKVDHKTKLQNNSDSSKLEDPTDSSIDNVLNENIKNLLLEDRKPKELEANIEREPSKQKQKVPMLA